MGSLCTLSKVMWPQTLSLSFLDLTKASQKHLCHKMKQNNCNTAFNLNDNNIELMSLSGKPFPWSSSVILCELARLPAHSHGTLASFSHVDLWKLRKRADFVPAFKAHPPPPPPPSHPPPLTGHYTEGGISKSVSLLC